MCGILGVLRRSPSRDNAFSSEHLALLRHRGPDGQGAYSDGMVALGHTRLSIIDLSSLGAQPMSYAKGRYVITFNGKIYNYLELREELAAQGHAFASRSDTEVILAAYHAYGPSCVERFRGMFAFAIWDRGEQTLFLARDRCGERPLIYWQDEEQFIFASEFKALLPLLPSRPGLDPSAIDMFMHFQYVPEPFTLLEGVHKLPAAHTLTISTSDWRTSLKSYWDFESVSPSLGPPCDCIRAEFEKSITLALRSDVPVGVALSGGIDSSAIAALASKHYPEPMHAISVGYPGRPANDEREQARSLANRLGMIFHEVELPVGDFLDFFPQLVRILDEPIADPAAFCHYAVPKAASDLGIKVLLTGIGGDELFWGYDWVARAVRLNRIRTSLSGMPGGKILRSAILSSPAKFLAAWRTLPRALRNSLKTLRSACCPMTPENQLVFMTSNDDFNQAFRLKAGCYGPAMTVLPEETPFAPTKVSSQPSEKTDLAVLRLLFKTWLVSNCLTLGDRVSMSVGVETRIPFLDHRLIELVMGLRKHSPDHMLGHKAWLRQAMCGILPEEVLDRPKRGFEPPVWDWLSGVVRRYGRELRGGELEAAGITSRKGIDSLLENVNSLGWPGLFFVYKLVLLEQWVRLLVSDAGSRPIKI